MRILHFIKCPPNAIRVQRNLFSNLASGHQALVFFPSNLASWNPMNKIAQGYETAGYLGSRGLSYLMPDPSLKKHLSKVFKTFKGTLVHAHNLETAWFSLRAGLPTVYDDWEYNPVHYVHFIDPPLDDSRMRIVSRFLFKRVKSLAHSTVEAMIREVPTIVTNDNVREEYLSLGASDVWTVPNVPLKYELEYGLAERQEKTPWPSACYIGTMSEDEGSVLRNTSGVREFWEAHDLGHLFVFEGKNYVPHLDLFREIQRFHFNLLYWRPLNVHRFYLQNKAFIASVMGVPTMISSSLKATIELLGEYAIPVDTLKEMPEAIENHLSRKYTLNPAHLWEYYGDRIRDAYEDAIDRVRVS